MAEGRSLTLVAATVAAFAPHCIVPTAFAIAADDQRQSKRIFLRSGCVKKSAQVALGGLASALCLLFMFMTGMIPFATYVLPAAAGVVLVAVVCENGNRTALLVYLAVSLLSIFVVPDREAAFMFIFFFGYYPIIKEALDKITFFPLRFVVKQVIFNIAIITGYYFIIYALGMPDIMTDFGDFGKYSVYVLLGVGNITFIIYDFALKNIFFLYRHWFRPKILRRTS